MSAGNMSLHSMSAVTHPGGSPGGPRLHGRVPSIPESGGVEEYLEPTGPQVTTPQGDQAWQHRREGYKPRALIGQLDSGVADVDGLHLMVDSNMNGIGPRSSDVSLPPSIADRERMRRPDSLAIRGHEYEELPASRYQAGYGYQDMDDNSGSGSGSAPRPLPPPMLNKLKSHQPHADSNESLVRPLSGTSSNGGLHQDRISNTYRKRENPLYDEGEPDDLEQKPKKPCGALACPCSGFIVVALVALVSLVLAILLLAGSVQPKEDVSVSPEIAEVVAQLNQSSLITALAKMNRIESQYNMLLQKYSLLENSLNLTILNNGTQVSTGVDQNGKAISWLLRDSELQTRDILKLSEKVKNMSNVISKHNESHYELRMKYNSLQQKFIQLNTSVHHELESLKQNITSSNSTLYSKLTQVEKEFNDRLDLAEADIDRKIGKVAKLEGPRGPRGPAGTGNLSVCESFLQKRGTASSTSSTVTDWWPKNADDHQNWVIMGVECTTTGGESSLMGARQSTVANFRDELQYMCTCRGEDGASPSRFCILNIWRCPRIS